MTQKRQDPKTIIQHPAWCDRERCTATTEPSTGGAHRSVLTRFSADAGLTRLEITAALYQAHAPWLTELYVDVEFSGLERDWTAITGTACLPAKQLLGLGRFLTNLGQAAVIDYAAQVEASLSALAKKASRS